MNPRPPYSTDITDTEWELIKPSVPEAKPGGRPEVYPKREILNGIFYLLRTGCAWRLLPHDLPPWRIVYYDFWQWRKDSSWQVMHDLLRGDVRVAVGAAALAERPPRDCQAAYRPQGLPGAPVALDRGTDLRVVGPLPPLIEGLCVFTPHQ
jgi:putative transposase